MLDPTLSFPETDIFCQFLDPETDVMCPFLGPETNPKYQFLVDICLSCVVSFWLISAYHVWLIYGPPNLLRLGKVTMCLRKARDGHHKKNSRARLNLTLPSLKYGQPM